MYYLVFFPPDLCSSNLFPQICARAPQGACLGDQNSKNIEKVKGCEWSGAWQDILLMLLLQAFIFTESLPLECEALLAKGCLFSTFHVLTFFLNITRQDIIIIMNIYKEHTLFRQCVEHLGITSLNPHNNFMGSYDYTHCVDKEIEASKN